MATPKDMSTHSGWKSELDPYPEASELEFLRWFYQNSDDDLRDQMRLRFMQEQQKAVPALGLI